MKLKILLVLIFCNFIFIFTSAFACSCIETKPTYEAQIKDIRRSLKNSAVVFLGKCLMGKLIVIQPEGDSEDKYMSVEWTFEIQKPIKGLSGKKEVTVQSGIGRGDCGVNFRPGWSYLVYTRSVNGSLTTGICSRTKEAGMYPIMIDGESKWELERIDEFMNK